MNLQAFWQELDSRIAKYDLLCHPFYKAWSMGELTREDLRAYAADYYHHVAAFPEYLKILEERTNGLPGMNADEPGLTAVIAQNREDEEGVGSPDGRSHAELWLDFAEGMGGDREAARGSEPVAEVKELVVTFQKIARKGSPAEALTAFYTYESQVPRVAKEKARGLREMYGADAKTCGYFTLHQTADAHHAQVWKEQLENQFRVSGFEFQEKALVTAEEAAKALWRALDGIERERLERTAA